MLGRPLEFAHGPDDLVFTLVEIVHWGGGGHRSLQVAVEVFVWVAFRAVGRQIEDFDLGGGFQQPGFDRGAVMDFEIVHDEEDLACGVFDQSFQ